MRDAPDPNESSVEQSAIRLALVDETDLMNHGVRSLLAPFGDDVELVEASLGAPPKSAVDIALIDPARCFWRGGVAARASYLRVVWAQHVVLYEWLPNCGRGGLPEPTANRVIAKQSTGDELFGALRDAVGGVKVNTGVSEPVLLSLPFGLSNRDFQVLELVAHGYTNRRIAAALMISYDTVKTHIASMLDTLNVNNRTMAAVVGRSIGLGDRFDRSF